MKIQLPAAAVLCAAMLLSVSSSADPARMQTQTQMRTAPTQADETAVLSTVRGITIDKSKMRAHVMRPANVINGRTDDGPSVAPSALPQPGGLSGPAVKHLDVAAFGQSLHAQLKSSVAGYVMQMRKNGKTIYTLQWNWAKRPTDGSLGWNPDRRMHVASVSKFITAVAMTKLLNSKGISYDAKIINYLPAYWSKGPNINQISFRNLMTHRSGFYYGGSNSDYSTMKQQVAMGVPAVGGYKYMNTNFGICRILMAVINGNISKSTPGFDQLWDYITILAYNNYVQDNVFTPSGVQAATLDHPSSLALAYNFPVSGGGWNSGNLETMSGGAGWHMSVHQLLNVMDTFRRKGTIMLPSKAQDMLSNSFGIDQIISTSAGTLYDKNGLWEDAANQTNHVEQSVIFFMPDGMELALLVNSPISSSPQSLRNIVTNTFKANLK